jgi:hypothetical protein
MIDDQVTAGNVAAALQLKGFLLALPAAAAVLGRASTELLQVIAQTCLHTSTSAVLDILGEVLDPDASQERDTLQNLLQQCYAVKVGVSGNKEGRGIFNILI